MTSLREAMDETPSSAVLFYNSQCGKSRELGMQYNEEARTLQRYGVMPYRMEVTEEDLPHLGEHYGVHGFPKVVLRTNGTTRAYRSRETLREWVETNAPGPHTHLAEFTLHTRHAIVSAPLQNQIVLALSPQHDPKAHHDEIRAMEQALDAVYETRTTRPAQYKYAYLRFDHEHHQALTSLGLMTATGHPVHEGPVLVSVTRTQEGTIQKVEQYEAGGQNLTELIETM